MIGSEWTAVWTSSPSAHLPVVPTCSSTLVSRFGLAIRAASPPYNHAAYGRSSSCTVSMVMSCGV
jgi:hypothetical protein